MTTTELKKKIVRSQSGNVNSPSDDDLFSIIYSLCSIVEELQQKIEAGPPAMCKNCPKQWRCIIACPEANKALNV